MTAGLYSAEQSRCKDSERVAENIGHHNIKLSFRHLFGQVKVRVCLVYFRIIVGRFDRLRINVRTEHLGGAEFFSGNRKNARAAAVVQNGFAADALSDAYPCRTRHPDPDEC